MKRLAHKIENFSVAVDGKTNVEIIQEIQDAGYKLGKASLVALLDGSKLSVGDFEMIEIKFDSKTKEQKAAEKLAEKNAKIAAKAAEPKPEADVKVAPVKAARKLTPEPGTVTAKTPKIKAVPVIKPPRVLNDVSHLLKNEPTAVLRGSVQGRLFEMLCRENGANKEQLMTEFGWSAGGMAGVIHWDIKQKGYALHSEKLDGVLTYFLHFHDRDGGGRVRPEQILYREKKVVPVKEPKVAKVAAPVAEVTPVVVKKVKVSKADLANVPSPSAQVTTRRVVKAAKV